MNATDGHFSGATYDAARDGKRLGAQLSAVIAVMKDGRWRTLCELAGLCDSPEASVSARLRDMRRLGWEVQRRYIERGQWTYSATVRAPDNRQMELAV